MAVTTTTRLGVTRWSAGSDPFTRAQMDASHAALELNGAKWLPADVLANRPAASAAVARCFYDATDQPTSSRLSWCDGAAWHPVMIDVSADVAVHESRIDAIELEMGANPSGASADIAARLGALDATVTALLPPGLVLSFAGPAAPTGYLLCQGQTVSRAAYAALYAALGGAASPWGQGDGSTTFGVPDLRGRTIIGAGTGVGLTARAIAALVGTETHLLIVAEIPAHTHIQNSHTHIQDAHTHTQNAHTHGAGGGGGSGFLADSGTGATTYSVNQGTFYTFKTNGTTSVAAVNQNAVATNQGTTATNQNAGGGGAHNNMQPSVAMHCIIKT